MTTETHLMKAGTTVKPDQFFSVEIRHKDGHIRIISLFFFKSQNNKRKKTILALIKINSAKYSFLYKNLKSLVKIKFPLDYLKKKKWQNAKNG